MNSFINAHRTFLPSFLDELSSWVTLIVLQYFPEGSVEWVYCERDTPIGKSNKNKITIPIYSLINSLFWS